ncbi:hypothetical protein SRRS_12110 [Sporomusa rhizae]
MPLLQKTMNGFLQEEIKKDHIRRIIHPTHAIHRLLLQNQDTGNTLAEPVNASRQTGIKIYSSE